MLNEKLFVQVEYDRATAKIKSLDINRRIAEEVYQAERKAAEENIRIFSKRLSEIEKQEVQLKKENENE